MIEKPERYRVEDGYLNMKEKRLEGVFHSKPRIYSTLMKAAKYRTHEPELVIITVEKLGIKGWIKGER